eukprot:g15765.t1
MKGRVEDPDWEGLTNLVPELKTAPAQKALSTTVDFLFKTAVKQRKIPDSYTQQLQQWFTAAKTRHREGKPYQPVYFEAVSDTHIGKARIIEGDMFSLTSLLNVEEKFNCLYADLPYNISLLEADQTKINEEKIKGLLNQFSVVGNSDKRIVVFHLHPSQYNMLVSALLTTGFQTIETVYWYKENHNYVGAPQKWIKAVEMLLVAFYPKQGSFVLNLDKNPLKRHNIYTVRVPAKKQRHDEGGERVNVFEKLPELARRILSDILLPHSKVLVICMGSGSEVIVALQANMTVVGIESDGAQVEFCKQRVRQFYEPPKQKGRKKKALADQEEDEEEGAEEEEDVDTGEVDKELEEKGSVGASLESSSVSSCFTCKGEVKQ